MDPLDSLSHPLRRKILCALVASEEPLPPSALATRIPGTSASEVGYHARVLESSGAVGRTRAGGAEEDRYRAADLDPETLEFLEAKRETDAS